MNDTTKDTAEMGAFSLRLVDRMARQGLSQSDLARAIWGTVVDARGRDVARNRDRISNYTRGRQMPEPSTLRKIAAALDCAATDLNPPAHRTARPVELTGALPATGLRFTQIGGRADLALLELHRVVPTALALKIMLLLSDVPDESGEDSEA